MIVWVSPLFNLIMWVLYLSSAGVLIWGLTPRWGGWHTLNGIGKTLVLCGAVVCTVSSYNLITTTVIPF